MKVIIVGGVAGGASAAARLRRLDETAEIVLLERGEYVSYANCGLPYYIGGVIEDRDALSVQTPQSLRARLNLDVRTMQEAVAVDPAGKRVRIRRADGTTYEEGYDKLILSPGASPIIPPMDGVDAPGVFTLRTIPDTLRIAEYIKERKARRAVVIGGGYIGLEMAENLVEAGLAVTVVERGDHLIAPLDREMAMPVQRYLREKGVRVLLEQAVESIERVADGLVVHTAGGGAIGADLVMLSVGVRPEGELARAAGLRVNARGAIVVDAHMRTSDPDIYAVGDAVEITVRPSGLPGSIPLAGPANKQGRIAADNIAGIPTTYKGTQGTALLKLFDTTVGTTGLNETAARQAGIAYDKVYLAPPSHAGYYPGATPLLMKVLFAVPSGRILGAQLVGQDGVDKRTDVLSVAIQHGMDAADLAELELGYAPPYSSAKDPVNMAGFMIENVLAGRVAQFHLDDIEGLLAAGTVLVDVRTKAEYDAGHIPGAVHIPLDELRARLDALPRGEDAGPVYLYCRSGQRSYMAARVLAGHGRTVRHLAGGYQLYALVRDGAGMDDAGADGAQEVRA